MSEFTQISKHWFKLSPGYLEFQSERMHGLIGFYHRNMDVKSQPFFRISLARINDRWNFSAHIFWDLLSCKWQLDLPFVCWRGSRDYEPLIRISLFKARKFNYEEYCKRCQDACRRVREKEQELFDKSSSDKEVA